MEPKIDPPLVVASLIVLGILVGSFALWIECFRRPKNVIREMMTENRVPAWNIGWVNFGIFVCVLIITVFTVQNIAALFFLPPTEAEEHRALSPSLAIFAVLLLQLPMLAVFYAARRFYPGYYAGGLNGVDLSICDSLRQAAPLFLMFLPLIWIVSLVWTNTLGGFQTAGWIEEIEQQELVTLFQNGGHPMAMLLLVILAVIMAPVVEEIIFRGCIYRFLKSQTSLLVAQIISGCIFSIMHANLLSFVPLIFVGILLARIYEKTGSLNASMWFHALFNAFSLLMLFITSMSDAIPQ
ncbi:MAG: type II CAAX endopeptidase family protein [Verrucomicrobiota bacterium]|nr:type II CAAX endopeptidase family protein [Verrucomicrobiota bacterium]